MIYTGTGIQGVQMTKSWMDKFVKATKRWNWAPGCLVERVLRPGSMLNYSGNSMPEIYCTRKIKERWRYMRSVIDDNLLANNGRTKCVSRFLPWRYHYCSVCHQNTGTRIADELSCQCCGAERFFRIRIRIHNFFLRIRIRIRILRLIFWTKFFQKVPLIAYIPVPVCVLEPVLQEEVLQ
jgi:hypothetical protein